MSQNEERLKQKLRDETHEINEMSDTIQHLTEQRDELEKRLHDFQQQIESIDELKKEISEKNKVNYDEIYMFEGRILINFLTILIILDNQNAESAIG